jgi:hypothetical protein
VRRLLLVVVALLASVEMALACTAYLTGEQVVTVKRNGYVRNLRLCYYDHLGDPLMVTTTADRFCQTTLSVPHPGEDRDGDGKDDGEEQE